MGKKYHSNKLDTLQKRVAYLLSNLNETYDSLAEALGVNRNTIMSYKKGKGDLKGIVIENLAIKYSVNANWLLKGQGEIFLRHSKKRKVPDSAQSVAMTEGDLKKAIVAIGDRIKERRGFVGLTQEILAKEIGVSKTTIQNYEAGSIPKGKHLISLAQSLKCTTDWLLTGIGTTYSREESAGWVDVIENETQEDYERDEMMSSLVKTIDDSPNLTLDTVLLGKIIVGIESWIAKEKIDIDIEKKSRIISIIYEQFFSNKKLFDEDTLRRFMRIGLK